MYPFYREFELIKPVCDYFTTKGYRIFHEVSIGFCRADIVAIKENMVTAVELKLSDKKKAIVQAKNYQFGADFVYLAFPLTKIHQIIQTSQQLLIKEGIGLLSIHENDCSISVVIKAQQSQKKFASLTEQEITRNKKKKGRKQDINIKNSFSDDICVIDIQFLVNQKY
jgi:hypothetical protein